MPLNRYYQQERAFLREDFGPEFAKANPAIASVLGSVSSDPDVERLLDGFAFLTGRIREKLDDEYPELVYRLLSILSPHLVTPTPSATIIQFDPIANRLTDSRVVAKHTAFESEVVDGTVCTFRTCFDVTVHPLTIASAIVNSTGTRLNLNFTVAKGIAISNLKLQQIRLYLAGESAFDLYAALADPDCRTSFVDITETGERVLHRLGSPSPGGLAAHEAMLPFPSASFQGFRLLHEYLAFPEKFLFIDLGLGTVFKSSKGSGFTIQLEFERPLPPLWRPSPDAFKLNCVPAVNVFEDTSYPLDITHERTEYRILPPQSGTEIYSVLGARAWIDGTRDPRRYEPLLSLEREPDVTYYTVQTRQGVNAEDRRTYVSLLSVQAETETPIVENAVFQILCSNGSLTNRLRVGDICRPTDTSPDFALFSNISRVSHYIPVSIPAERPWQLLSHLVLGPATLESITALRSLLQLFNFPDSVDANRARANRGRIDAITAIRAVNRDFVMTRDTDPERHFAGRYGLPMRGRAVEIDLQGSKFSSEGEIAVFGTVLIRFLGQYATMNSLTSLRINNVATGARFDWHPRPGDERVI